MIDYVYDYVYELKGFGECDYQSLLFLGVEYY